MGDLHTGSLAGVPFVGIIGFILATGTLPTTPLTRSNGFEKTYDDIKKCEWLVNSQVGMISNAKKWDKYITLPVAREIDNYRGLMFIVEPTDEPYYQ